jgi:hypothetical protein
MGQTSRKISRVAECVAAAADVPACSSSPIDTEAGGRQVNGPKRAGGIFIGGGYAVEPTSSAHQADTTTRGGVFIGAGGY